MSLPVTPVVGGVVVRGVPALVHIQRGAPGGRALVVELEAYDAPLGGRAVATSSPSWWWGSASVSLRWAI